MALMAIRCITCARPTGGVIDADKYNELENSKKICVSCISYTNPNGITVQPIVQDAPRWICPDCEADDGLIYARESIRQFRGGNLESVGGTVWLGGVNNDEIEDSDVFCSHCDSMVSPDSYVSVEYN